MSSLLKSSALVGGSCLLLLGCGPATLSKDPLPVSFSTGGHVFHYGPSSGYSQWLPLAGVTVTVDGEGGTSSVATTDSGGNWVLHDVSPGVYNVVYQREGFETQERTVELDAFGDNQVSNPYQSAGEIWMQESNDGTFGPFGVTLKSGQVAYDGLGYRLHYGVAAGGDITLTLSNRVTGIYYQGVTLTDHVTGRTITAVVDTSNATTFRFTKAAIDGMNGGSPLTVGGNPLYQPEIRSQYAMVVAPSGRQDYYYSRLFFTADP